MMKIVLGCAVLLTLGMAPQEKSVITTPVVANVTVLDYQVASILIGRLPDWHIDVTYVDNLGKVYHDEHTGTVDAFGQTAADALVLALNKSNLTTKSLERRILEHLIAEGKIPAATITGAPQ